MDIAIVIHFLSMGVSIAITIAEFKKNERVKAIGAVVVTIIAFILGVVVIQPQEPEIERADDYSAIIISADKGLQIQYKIRDSKGEKWKKYTKPFKVEQNTIVYARTHNLFYFSKKVYRDVYVEDNGLIDFGGADVPKKTLKQLKATYQYKDPQSGKAGNYYVGCEIAKNDIEVTGNDVDGNSIEVKDFTYSPQILEKGKNDIEVSYMLVNGTSISTHLYIEAEDPKLIKLRADCKKKTWFTGTELSNNDLTVKGLYEDGTEKDITDYALSATLIKRGENEITVTKDEFSVGISISGVDKESITEEEQESNDDLNTANDIDPNVRYTGKLQDEDDVDYYRVQLDKKGRIILKFKHPKIDSDSTYWRVSLLGTDETEKVKMDVSGGEVESASSVVRVMPGVYYVKVSRDYYSAEKYILTVNFEEEGEYYEIEPNDDLTSQAMAIKINKTYTGNLTNSEDEDCYQFHLNEKRKVRLEFSHSKKNSDDRFWKVALLGEADGSLTEIYSTGTAAKENSDYVRLPAGDYYVQVKAYYWTDIDYSFCVAAKKESINTENEENDDYGTATKIALGVGITGNIQSGDDVDFYKLVLEKTSNIKLTFTHELINSDSRYWKIILYSEASGDGLVNSDDESTMYICGNSPKNTSALWEDLPAGIYYIKVQAEYYDNDDYQLKVANY